MLNSRVTVGDPVLSAGVQTPPKPAPSWTHPCAMRHVFLIAGSNMIRDTVHGLDVDILASALVVLSSFNISQS